MSDDTIARVKEKILSQILRMPAFEVTASQPPEAPYSIDFMKLAGSALALKETARAYQLLFRAEGLQNIQRIAGVSPSGETFAALLSYLEKKPLLWLSAVATTPQMRIMGLLQPGDSVLLVDGVHEPTVLAEAASIIQAEGGLANDAIVLIGSRQTGSTTERTVKVHALLSVPEIVNYMASKGAIDKRQVSFLQNHQ
jgi:orotate phosphoribosyltransferase